MIQKKFTLRLKYYIILLGLVICVPYITTLLAIIITGDRVEGMTYATLPSIVLIHLVFVFIFLKTNIIIKMIAWIANTLLILLALKYILPLKLIHDVIDIYGFWDTAITHSIIAILIWEIFYNVLCKILDEKQLLNKWHI